MLHPVSLAPQSSTRNTTTGSYTSLQLHDPQTRKERSTLYVQLHNPQRETQPLAPLRVSSSNTHKLENNAPPCMFGSTTLNEKHQQRLLCGYPAPRSSTRNTNNGSSACLQLHETQPETPSTAPPRVSWSVTHKLENNAPPCISSSTTLKEKHQERLLRRLHLDDPQLETPTPAPPRVSSSMTHKLENNPPPCISSSMTVKQKHQQRLLRRFHLDDPQLETPTPAPPWVSSSTTLN
ncbi:PREDICTED: uncharacterized protein LOC105586001 [Cercocebus atys]|uniref:uncharacterized protein LOC105586001 n=1 Tax=Cercocebus atys TaxID=9531 RepID=UPI0005F37133|nr:PREDICTED: uncharacterized protein LOC105586001 [Cercocebus atys]